LPSMQRGSTPRCHRLPPFWSRTDASLHPPSFSRADLSPSQVQGGAAPGGRDQEGRPA
jgi:hypothetical protein